jgi:hypothetical protein
MPSTTTKPACHLAGTTDLVKIAAVVAYALRQAGLSETDFRRRARTARSLDALLQIAQEFVELDAAGDPLIVQLALLEEDLHHAEYQIEQAQATLEQPDTIDAARRVATSTLSYYRTQATRLRTQIAAARRRMGETEGEEQSN